MREVFGNIELKLHQVTHNEKMAFYLLLLAVIPGTFLSNFSAGLVNIALTDISMEFHISLGMSQWVVTGYILTVMISLPIMGKLSDQFGKKRIHNVGYLLFGVGVLFSFSANNIMFLLIARFIQGVGAAMLQAVNMVIITENVSVDKRVKAIGLVGTAAGLGGLLGAPIGGVLIELFHWSYLFLIQLPVIAIVSVFAILFIPKDKRFTKSKFDLGGAVLFTIFLVGAIFLLNQFGEGIIYKEQWIIGLISLSSLTIFYYWTNKQSTPFITIALFKQKKVCLGAIVIVVSYATCFGTVVILPFLLRGVMHYSITITGLVLMVYPLFLSITGPFSGRLVQKYNLKTTIIIAIISMTIAVIGLSFTSIHSPLLHIALLLALLGVSMGLITSPNYNFIMGSVPKTFLGEIGGNIALLRNFGMVIGTALGIAIVNHFATTPVSQWLTLTNSEDVTSLLLGIKSVFILFALLLIVIGLIFKYLIKE